MAYFPGLKGQGLGAAFPLTCEWNFPSEIEIQPGGKRRARAESTRVYRAWSLPFEALRKADVETLIDFYRAHGGPHETFIFLDPNGNLIADSEQFESAPTWVRSGSFIAGAPDPFGGSAARSTGAFALSADVLPGGAANAGLVLNASLYVRQGTVTVGLQAGGGWLGQRTMTVGDSWIRISAASAIATDQPVTFRAEGSASAVFGAQVAATPGPGSYLKSPTLKGYHPKVRFATEPIAIARSHRNEGRTTLRLIEVA
jgi:hypothetical protein